MTLDLCGAAVKRPTEEGEDAMAALKHHIHTKQTTFLSFVQSQKLAHVFLSFFVVVVDRVAMQIQDSFCPLRFS